MKITDSKHVMLTKQGFLNTTGTRIDFTSPFWVRQFEDILTALSNIDSMSPEELSLWASSSEGISKGLFSQTHSIISNVCLSKKQDVAFFHEKEPSLLQEAKAYNQDELFYQTRVETRSPGNYPTEDQLKHVFILNDHGLQDEYALLDTFSILLRIAIHPEEYPPFMKWLDYNGGLDTNTDWVLFFRKLVSDLFGERRPAEINFSQYNEIRKRNKLCDSFMVFLGPWDVQRTGLMIPEPIAVDLVRAAAYKRLDIPVHQKKEQMEKQLVVAAGMYLNYDDIMSHLQKTYGETITIKELVLSQETRKVVSVLAMTDVLLSVQMPSVVKAVFMLPESVVLLAQPPGYKDLRLKTFVTSVGLRYMSVQVDGQPLKECAQSITQKVCMEAVKSYQYTILPPALDQCLTSLAHSHV